MKKKWDMKNRQTDKSKSRKSSWVQFRDLISGFFAPCKKVINLRFRTHAYSYVCETQLEISFPIPIKFLYVTSVDVKFITIRLSVVIYDLKKAEIYTLYLFNILYQSLVHSKCMNSYFTMRSYRLWLAEISLKSSAQ